MLFQPRPIDYTVILPRVWNETNLRNDVNELKEEGFGEGNRFIHGSDVKDDTLKKLGPTSDGSGSRFLFTPPLSLSLNKMPCYCAVYGCDSKFIKDGKESFFTFPKDDELCQKWIHLCGRDDNYKFTHARICSKHFPLDSYERNLKYELLGLPVPAQKRKFKPGTLPMLHLVKHFVKCRLFFRLRILNRNIRNPKKVQTKMKKLLK